MITIIAQHVFLIFLGVLLFFITNYIGKYSKNFGYSEIKFDIHSDELIGFNFILRIFTPVVFTILIASILYYFKLDQLTKNIYLLVAYSFIFRAFWNISHNRTLLINWRIQALYASIAITSTYLAYKFLILPKAPLLPDFQTIANELWIIILLFIYKIFNEIKIPTIYKENRVRRYLNNRYVTFKYKFENKINERLHTEFETFLSKVNLQLKSSTVEDDYQLLRHCKLPFFKDLCINYLRKLTYSIMIHEDYNRPFVFRKLESLSCKLRGKSHTQGIMQCTSNTPIDDIESITIAIRRIYLSLFDCLNDPNLTMIWSDRITSQIAYDYNPSSVYENSIHTILGLIFEYEAGYNLEAFLNDPTQIDLPLVQGE